MLDEIEENETPKVPKNKNDQQQEQQVPKTSASIVIRSTMLSRPPE